MGTVKEILYVVLFKIIYAGGAGIFHIRGWKPGSTGFRFIGDK
jgi:hypothetical protein